MATPEASDEPWGDQLRRWREETVRYSQEELVQRLVAIAYANNAEERGTKLTTEVVGRWERGVVQRPQGIYRRLLGQLGAPLPTPSARSSTRTTPRPSAEQDPAEPAQRPLKNENAVSATTEPGTTRLDPAMDGIKDGVHYPDDVATSIEVIKRLADADLTDDPAVTALGWTQKATPGIVYNYLSSSLLTGDLILLGETPTSIASRILATVQSFLDLDFQYGGGHVRWMLLTYWKSEVVPALRKSYPEPVRREIFSAAAEAAEVLAWSAYDTGRHGLAQRYYIQGLRLAREAGDRLAGAHILADLSHQANYLGHYDDAVRLARCAQLATGGNGPATAEAMFLAMEARGLASQGNHGDCINALHRAEQAFDRSDPANDPAWISYFDSFELAGEASHCFRDLGRPEETMRFTTQALDPVHTPPRTRGFINMVSADGALAGGDLEEAVSLATNAVHLAGTLRSDRYLRYVRDFHGMLTSKYATNPMVRGFDDLIRQTYPTPKVKDG